MTEEKAAPLARPTGWFHSEKSVAAHFFEDGRPVCQDSDPGAIVPREPDEESLGRTCETCVRVIKSRVLHALRTQAAASPKEGVVERPETDH